MAPEEHHVNFELNKLPFRSLMAAVLSKVVVLLFLTYCLLLLSLWPSLCVGSSVFGPSFVMRYTKCPF